MKNFKTWLAEDWRPSLEFPHQGTQGKISFVNHLAKPVLQRLDALQNQIEPGDRPAVANARSDIKNYLFDLRNKSFGGYDVSDEPYTPGEQTPPAPATKKTFNLSNKNSVGQMNFRPITSQHSFRNIVQQMIDQGMSEEEARKTAYDYLGQKKYGTGFRVPGDKKDAYGIEGSGPPVSFRDYLNRRSQPKTG